MFFSRTLDELVTSKDKCYFFGIILHETGRIASKKIAFCPLEPKDCGEFLAIMWLSALFVVAKYLPSY